MGAILSTTTGSIGRAATGRFLPGNTFSRGYGNPYAKAVAQARRTLVGSVSDDDIREIAKALVDKAKAGDTGAAKLVLGYVVGPVNDVIGVAVLDREDREDSVTALLNLVPDETIVAAIRLANSLPDADSTRNVEDSRLL